MFTIIGKLINNNSFFLLCCLAEIGYCFVYFFKNKACAVKRHQENTDCVYHILNFYGNLNAVLGLAVQCYLRQHVACNLTHKVVCMQSVACNLVASCGSPFTVIKLSLPNFSEKCFCLVKSYRNNYETVKQKPVFTLFLYSPTDCVDTCLCTFIPIRIL